MARKASQQDGADSPKKSGAVTVRLDPKLKYLADLAARKQRRPLSGFIEWAVEQSLSQVVLAEDEYGNAPPTSLAEAERNLGLWDVDEPDRVAKLATNFPELLNYDEQLIWKLVRTNGAVWKHRFKDGDWSWEINAKSLKWNMFRDNWHLFKAVAEGKLDVDELPDWEFPLTSPDEPSSGGWDSGPPDDDPEEIPF